MNITLTIQQFLKRRRKMQRQRYTVIGTKNGYNVKDFIMAYSETEARLLYKRSRPDVEVTECYLEKFKNTKEYIDDRLQAKVEHFESCNYCDYGSIVKGDWHKVAQDEIAEVTAYKMYSDGRVERTDNKKEEDE